MPRTVSSNVSSSNGFSITRAWLTPRAARRRGGTPVSSATGMLGNRLRQLGHQAVWSARARDHEVRQDGRGPVAGGAPVAGRAHIADERRLEARFTQNLRDQPRDVRVVFDDQNDVSGFH